MGTCYRIVVQALITKFPAHARINYPTLELARVGGKGKLNRPSGLPC